MGKKDRKGKKAKKAGKTKQVVVVQAPAGPGLGAAILTQAIAAGVAYGVARHLAAARPAAPAPRHGLARFVTRHPRAAWDLALWQGGERLRAWGQTLRRHLHHKREDDLPPPRGIPDQRYSPYEKSDT